MASALAVRVSVPAVSALVIVTYGVGTPPSCWRSQRIRVRRGRRPRGSNAKGAHPPDGDADPLRFEPVLGMAYNILRQLRDATPTSSALGGPVPD